MPAWRTRHVARTCPAYAPIWAKDQQIKLFAAAEAYEEQLRTVAPEVAVRMYTVTAPGVDFGLVWDPSFCEHLGPHKHSGTLGCRVAVGAADQWNAAAPGRWSRLHSVCATIAERETGSRPVLIFKVWEEQKRGVLHAHLVVGYSTLAERRAADIYFLELRARAADYLFGSVDEGERIDARRAAGYLASYFVSGRGHKATLTESAISRKLPKVPIYVSNKLTARSGITMRSLRLRRYAHHLWRTLIVPQGLGEEVDAWDVWQGLQEGKSLVAVVTARLEQPFVSSAVLVAA